jgi:cellulose synthase/poly-beta-1,6-N-acetylglucosamine synthase-like glycosyltransferase
VTTELAGTSVVLPVGDDSPLLDGCLEAIRAQEAPVGEVIVVDDSRRGDVRELDGVRVLRSGGRGPYAARNIGWRDAGGELVFFLDVRSRPRPQWSRRLEGAFKDPGVALVGSDVTILGGSSLGSRASERQQFFRLEKYNANAFFRPYSPTCNLATRRLDLDAVGGFREIRTGADADLCWRILDQPGRRLEAIDEVLMDWVPRESLWGYVGQNLRYGRSHWALRRSWAAAGAPQSQPMPHLLLARRIAGVTVRGALAVARGDDEAMLDELRKGGRFAYHVGYRLSADRARLGRDSAALP